MNSTHLFGSIQILCFLDFFSPCKNFHSLLRELRGEQIETQSQGTGIAQRERERRANTKQEFKGTRTLDHRAILERERERSYEMI